MAGDTAVNGRNATNAKSRVMSKVGAGEQAGVGRGGRMGGWTDGTDGRRARMREWTDGIDGRGGRMGGWTDEWTDVKHGWNRRTWREDGWTDGRNIWMGR